MTPSIRELQERAQQARADANEAFVRATSADTDVAETLAATRLAALEALAQVRINNDDRAAELAAEGLEEGAVVWRAQESGAIENVLETDTAHEAIQLAPRCDDAGAPQPPVWPSVPVEATRHRVTAGDALHSRRALSCAHGTARQHRRGTGASRTSTSLSLPRAACLLRSRTTESATLLRAPAKRRGTSKASASSPRAPVLEFPEWWRWRLHAGGRYLGHFAVPDLSGRARGDAARHAAVNPWVRSPVLQQLYRRLVLLTQQYAPKLPCLPQEFLWAPPHHQR